MNNKLFLFLFISLLSGFPAVSFAQVDTTMNVNPQYTKRWFWLGAIGVAKMTYHNDLEKQLNYYRNDVTHYSLDLDFGYYIRFSPSFLIGPVFNFGIDTFQNQSRWFQINQVMMGLSSVWDVSQDFRGFYFRGDLGLTNFLFSEKYGGYSTSHQGLASLLSIGYILNLLDKAKIAPYTTFQYSYVDLKSNYKLAIGVQFIY